MDLDAAHRQLSQSRTLLESSDAEVLELHSIELTPPPRLQIETSNRGSAGGSIEKGHERDRLKD